jgi:cell division protein ZapA (FtsZ GTPase activity inhibitor)
MQQGLASLLVRRTEEGRAKARRCIEAWQNAIAAVQRAERMAECKINLSIEQTQGVQQAAAEVDMANYVLAMHLANKAAAKRDAVITTAIGVLQEEIKHCDGELSGAQHGLQTAIRERDGVVTVAKKENDAGIQKIYEETTGSAGQARNIVLQNKIIGDH